MKSMAKKKMGGFMCHSPAATAVCMTPNSRSVIIPGQRSAAAAAERNKTTATATASEHKERLFKYSKLVEYHNHGDPRNSQKKLITTSALHSSIIKREQTLRSLLSTTDLQNPRSLTDHVFQVVVMRVSLHCQGCAGKLKKHISKMEGVTSFSIELEAKRVTVMGHVSPAGILESVSKIRRAEFWPDHCPQ